MPNAVNPGIGGCPSTPKSAKPSLLKFKEAEQGKSNRQTSDNKKQIIIPCGKCVSCQQLNKEIHPDVYFVERQKNRQDILIDQIRKLRSQLQMSSFFNSYKIAIIRQAEEMNKAAASALLKTLEEPTPRTILILIATNPGILPRTIVSRTQTLKLRPVSTEKIYDYLVTQKADRRTAKIISRLAKGRPGIAINLWQNKELLIDYQNQIQQLLTIINSSIVERFNLVADLTQPKATAVLDIWLGVFRDLLLIKNLAPDLIQHSFIQAELEELANRYSQDKLLMLFNQTREIQYYLGRNVNPRLALENLALLL